MDESKTDVQFSLIGGPLYRLGCVLGLVRGTNSIRLGLALSLFLWGILVLLSFLEGVSHQVFSLSVIGIHARLLLVIPLFFLCETLLEPRMVEFIRGLVAAKVIPDSARVQLNADILKIDRLRNAWLPEALCLFGAILASIFASYLHLFGTTAVQDAGTAAHAMTLFGQWYWVFCLTLFRFLILRWLWRIGLWSYFLFCIAKLNLSLVPTHPDNAAGIGYLEVVHLTFIPLILAISIIQSASFAEDIVTSKIAVQAIYPTLILMIIIDAVLFLGPLCIFSGKLVACRLKGLSTYMIFASHYVNNFDKKWIGTDATHNNALGTPDLQSLADLSNSVNIISNMSFVPFGKRLVIVFGVTAMLPMLPLLLFKYPFADLIGKFLSRLSGL